MKKSIVFFLSMYAVFGIQCFVMAPPGAASSEDFQRRVQEQYEKSTKAQTQYHALRTKGNQLSKEGKYQEALELHEKAFQMVEGTSLEAVSRNKLMVLYELTGNLPKALEQSEFFLTHSNQSSPLWESYVETNKRLLRKIKEQKEWEAKQDSVVPKFREVFKQASLEKQREFLEGLGAPGAMDAFKDAMVAEHAGDFKKALGIYEGLLPKRTDIQKELDVDGWVMLYPAIQRNAEMSGDTLKEKEALIWMKENLLPENARYHTSLSKLIPQNVAHIEKRIKDYQL